MRRPLRSGCRFDPGPEWSGHQPAAPQQDKPEPRLHHQSENRAHELRRWSQMETAGTTTIAAPTAYVGRHRSPKLHPRPLPLQHLDGLLDAAVTVHLGAGEPYVMLTSDVDQAIIELTPKQVHRILASAQRSTQVVDADFDPTDAELAVAWNGPDAHEAHRAAWQLHQEVH